MFESFQCKTFANIHFQSKIDESTDFVVAVNRETSELLRVPPEKRIFITMEPYLSTSENKQYAYYGDFAKDWKMPCLPFIAKPFDFLRDLRYEDLSKTRNLIIICSGKSFFPGHKKRLQLLRDICRIDGLEVDVYGRNLDPALCNGNYRGEIEGCCKFDVLSQYRYAVVIENCCRKNYVSEKLFDCFLCLTFPIYMGAPNVEQFFDDDSYLTLDTACLATQVSEKPNLQQQNALVCAKERTLREHNIFARIRDIVCKN